MFNRIYSWSDISITVKFSGTSGDQSDACDSTVGQLRQYLAQEFRIVQNNYLTYSKRDVIKELMIKWKSMSDLEKAGYTPISSPDNTSDSHIDNTNITNNNYNTNNNNNNDYNINNNNNNNNNDDNDNNDGATVAVLNDRPYYSVAQQNTGRKYKSTRLRITNYTNSSEPLSARDKIISLIKQSSSPQHSNSKKTCNISLYGSKLGLRNKSFTLRCINCYSVFTHDQFERIYLTMPHLPPRKVFSMIAKRWAKLSKDQRKQYKAKAKRINARLSLSITNEIDWPSVYKELTKCEDFSKQFYKKEDQLGYRNN